MSLNIAFLRKNLENNLFGRHIVYHQQTESTNDDAFSLAIKGAGEGTAVLADSQSRGRGRHQREWYSPPGKNIYVSVILKPKINLREASQIPIVAGVAMAETIERFYTGDISLKWPNDVLLDDKKVCGILTQLKVSHDMIHFIVLGVGLNVNIGWEEFPEDLKATASSLFMKTGTFFEREGVIIILFENLAKWYKKLLTAGFEDIKAAWMEKTDMIGKNVAIGCLGEVTSGRVVGIDDDGSLILINDKKEKITVSAGDATLLKE